MMIGKKLLLLLLFIPLMSIGQDDITLVESKTNISSYSNTENELVLSNEKTTIKNPLTADLNNYTHLLLVESEIMSSYGYVRTGHYALESLLSLTTFEIMNPQTVDKKRYRKETNYLKTMKNESYLYLYLIQARGKGDDVNTTFIVRDWKNKLIYNATHINTGLNEILAPLIDY